MIKLSDYLNYLNHEVVQARKQADGDAVLIAKEYAKHEYLKYFRVPRFSMPSVKMNIPLKISELNSDAKFNFKMDNESFLSEVNTKIGRVNKEKKLNMSFLKAETIRSKEFEETVKKLESSDYKFVKNIDESLNKIDFSKKFIKNDKIAITAVSKVEELEMSQILKETFKNRFQLVSAKLKDVFIDPDTSKETDKGKILLTLDVEMVEEGIRIREVKDKNGNLVEEIIFE